MIVVDSSALIAIVKGEPTADACADVPDANDRLILSAASLTEAMIVSLRQGRAFELSRFMDQLEFEIEPVDETLARGAIDAYARWGKGFHPARLNFGDCFAYALAKQLDCPLLYVGDDFAKTDILSAM